jgi:hypothetical protein
MVCIYRNLERGGRGGSSAGAVQYFASLVIYYHEMHYIMHFLDVVQALPVTCITNSF